MQKLLDFFRSTDRTKNIQANIAGSLVLKALSILLSLLIVPLTINYISPYQYGVWITLSSLIGWLSFFDIGFGNGLKNKFVEAITNGKFRQAQIYVSTTYALLVIIIFIVWTLAIFGAYFVNWSQFFNVKGISTSDLYFVLVIVLTTFACQFILGLLNTILTALQKPILTSIINIVTQFFILSGIYILTKISNGSLLNLSLIMGGANTIVLLCFSVYFFKTLLSKYSPQIKYVNFKFAKGLLTVGLNFFILQIIAIVYYETNNIIITKILSPLEVTIYNLAYKYAYVLGMMFSIIISPFWVGFIEARVLKDINWMNNMKRKLYIIFLGFIILGGLIILASPFLYKLWFGKAVIIPIKLTVLMVIWQLFNMWNSLHSTLIYGFAKIRLQLYSSTFLGLVNIPLTIFLCNKYGLLGVVLSQIILFTSISWIGPVQLNKLLKVNDIGNGIWYK